MMFVNHLYKIRELIVLIKTNTFCIETRIANYFVRYIGCLVFVLETSDANHLFCQIYRVFHFCVGNQRRKPLILSNIQGVSFLYRKSKSQTTHSVKYTECLIFVWETSYANHVFRQLYRVSHFCIENRRRKLLIPSNIHGISFLCGKPELQTSYSVKYTGCLILLNRKPAMQATYSVKYTGGFIFV